MKRKKKLKSKKPFIKFYPKSDKFSRLMKERPQAFLLLTLIAKRAKREDDSVLGLKKGEAIISDFKAYQATRQQHKTNQQWLKINQEITIRSTKKGTIAKLISKEIFDINVLVDNQETNQKPTITPPETNQEPIINQPLTKNIRNKEKEIKNNKHKKFSSLKDLTDEVIKEIADEYNVDFNYAKGKVERIKIWCSENGKKKKNYKSTLQNWILGDIEKGKAKMKIKTQENPFDDYKLPVDENQKTIKSMEEFRRTSPIFTTKPITNSPIQND